MQAQKEISPVVMWVVIGIVVLAVIGIGFGVLARGSFRKQSGGSEELMQKVQQGQPLYSPPPGAPVPGAGGGMMGGPPMGGMGGAPTGGAPMGGTPPGPR